MSPLTANSSNNASNKNVSTNEVSSSMGLLQLMLGQLQKQQVPQQHLQGDATAQTAQFKQQPHFLQQHQQQVKQPASLASSCAAGSSTSHGMATVSAANKHVKVPSTNDALSSSIGAASARIPMRTQSTPSPQIDAVSQVGSVRLDASVAEFAGKSKPQEVNASHKDGGTVAPCRARGMPKSHNARVSVSQGLGLLLICNNFGSFTIGHSLCACFCVVSSWQLLAECVLCIAQRYGSW